MSLFKLFFTTDIPNKLRYNSFTIPHFILLLFVGLGIFSTAGYIKASDLEKREKLLRIITWSLPCMYIFRFIVFALLDVFIEPQMSIMDRLPFHLCALNSIVMPLAVLKRNKLLLNYIYAVAMPGAFAAILTPAMSYYGRYAFFSWQILFFFIDHGLMVLIPVAAILCGIFKPHISMMPKVVLLFFGYAAVIYPVNKIFEQNYLFLNYPDTGTVMSFFAHYLGNPGYLAPMAVLVIFIVSAMYLPWVLRERNRKNA